MAFNTSPGKASENPNTIFSNCHTFDCVCSELQFLGFLFVSNVIIVTFPEDVFVGEGDKEAGGRHR